MRVGPRVRASRFPAGARAEGEGEAAELARSAARGRELARLLDPNAPVSGVTDGTLRPEMATIAVPATVDDRNMTGEDFAVTAGWGRSGSGDAVMPGQGRAVERRYSPTERVALGDAAPMLGPTTFRHLTSPAAAPLVETQAAACSPSEAPESPDRAGRDRAG